MKTISTLLICLFFFANTGFTQANQWTWVSGDSLVPQLPSLGIKGVANEKNTPGGRWGSVSIKDATGNFWLFGGYGYTVKGVGTMNDLWKFDISLKQWVYVSGDSIRNSVGNYGTKGVQSVTNKPRPRLNSVGWSDASGNLWFFGGVTTYQGTAEMNDLWKYNIASNQWTWVSGDSTLDSPSNYGVKGIASSTNKPGARQNSSAWFDVSGNLFLFGGQGNSMFNDLWKYNLASNQWTWVKGDSSQNPLPNFGVKGIASLQNTPGGKYSCTSWTDIAGNFWLFSGFSNVVNGNGPLSDLWKYNIATNEWTWVNGNNITASDTAIYGIKGVPNVTNKPGKRVNACGWTDATGKLWMFGGQGYNQFTGNGNDLWNYDIGTNQWTWVSGDSYVDNFLFGIYEEKGVSSNNNKPGSRQLISSWTDQNGNLWMFGGFGACTNNWNALNDLWKYNIASKQWTWEKGDSSFFLRGYYGSKGIISSKNKPGQRSNGLSWTDKTGNLWIFGGVGIGNNVSGNMNDLWKFNKTINEWTWVKGDSSTKSSGIYGTQGVANNTNTPSGRSYSVGWTDQFNNFWLFGGNSSISNLENDLWKFNTVANQWTWIKGDSIKGKPSVYGIKGISSTTNDPGARKFSTSWIDTSGNLWLFGGIKNKPGSSADFYLNDLWKYNPITNEWVWISGDSASNVKGFYGSKGFASNSNIPGSRSESMAWSDTLGNFWLFGGVYFDINKTNTFLYFNDLWKYNISTNQWTWISGDSTTNKLGNYGIKNISSVSNIPGARKGSVAYTDISGNLCLLGGLGYSSIQNNTFRLNDLWSYNTSTNEWTWKNGDSTIDQMSQYDVKGVSSAFGKPGGRASAMSSRDNEGNLWLYGGSGFSTWGSWTLNDLWKYSTETVQPVTLLSFTGKQKNVDAQLAWIVENEISFKQYQVERSSNARNFETIGSFFYNGKCFWKNFKQSFFRNIVSFFFQSIDCVV